MKSFQPLYKGKQKTSAGVISLCSGEALPPSLYVVSQNNKTKKTTFSGRAYFIPDLMFSAIWIDGQVKGKVSFIVRVFSKGIQKGKISKGKLLLSYSWTEGFVWRLGCATIAKGAIIFLTTILLPNITEKCLFFLRASLLNLLLKSFLGKSPVPAVCVCRISLWGIAHKQ